MKAAKVTTIECEHCGGAFGVRDDNLVRYEGFIVCEICVRAHARELQLRRELEDQRVRDMLGG